MTFSKASRAFTVILILLGSSWFSLASAQGTGLSVTVNLAEYDDSGITGTAYLIETTDGGTHVSMELKGENVEGNHPTHIHTGTCSNFSPEPLYPLETVNLSPVNQQGVSDSNIPGVSLASLRDGDFAIIVHRSPEMLTEYLVCGEIGGGTAGQAAKVKPGEGAAVAHHMPVAGSGTGLAGSTSFALAAAIVLAVVSTAGAVTLRLYARRIE